MATFDAKRALADLEAQGVPAAEARALIAQEMSRGLGYDYERAKADGADDASVIEFLQAGRPQKETPRAGPPSAAGGDLGAPETPDRRFINPGTGLPYVNKKQAETLERLINEKRMDPAKIRAGAVTWGTQNYPQPQTEAGVVPSGGSYYIDMEGRVVRNDDEPMSWGDVAKQAAANSEMSAVEFGKALIQPILHPIETAENLGDLGAGVLQLIRNISPAEYRGTASEADTGMAEAVGSFYKSRYGSLEGFKRALANDPVGVVSDISAVVQGGAGAAAQLPGRAGRVAGAVERVATAVDPGNLAVRGVELAGNVAGGVTRNILGMTTGAGPDAMSEAFNAGQGAALAPAQRLLGDTQGAETNLQIDRAFVDQMRGRGDVFAPVNDARAAVNEARSRRSSEYNADMASVEANPTLLPFSEVDDAVRNAERFASTHGGVVHSDAASAALARVRELVEEQRQGPWNTHHTAIGLDALKQRIREIGEGQDVHAKATALANSAASGIRDVVGRHVPEYLPIMDRYADASEDINNVERVFSLQERSGVPSNPETSLRALQSVYGGGRRFDGRASVGELFAEMGYPSVFAGAAGSAFREWYPRRMSSLPYVGAAAGAAGGASLLDAAGVLPDIGILPLVAAAGAVSPRAVGEATRAMGMAQAYPRAALRSLRDLYDNGHLSTAFPKAGLVGQGEENLRRLEEVYSRAEQPPPELPPSETEAYGETPEWREFMEGVLGGGEKEPTEGADPVNFTGGPEDITDPAVIKAAILAQEGTGDNPRSSAVGYGQFLKGTFTDYARKAYPELTKGKSDAQVLRLRGSVVDGQPIEARMLELFTEDNGRVLDDVGLPRNLTNTYTMHFFGPSDGKAVLTAPPDTPLRRVLSTSAPISSNPEVFRDVKTTGQAVARMRELMARRLAEKRGDHKT